jgi:uncharacterized tellurite resistance protein B-like protein
MNQNSNLIHFAHLVNLSLADGTIGIEEMPILERMATKLGLSEEEMNQVLENPLIERELNPQTIGRRFDYVYDFFQIVYADNRLDEEEYHLVSKYIGKLGFNGTEVSSIINRSIEIFEDGITKEIYKQLILK